MGELFRRIGPNGTREIGQPYGVATFARTIEPLPVEPDNTGKPAK